MYCLGPFTLVRPATIIDNTQALNRYDKLVNYCNGNVGNMKSPNDTVMTL